MTTVIILILVGFFIGFFISDFPKIISLVDSLTSWCIYLLLFCLGIGVGINEYIMRNLHTIGLQSLILTIGALAGSLFFAYLTYHFFFKK